MGKFYKHISRNAELPPGTIVEDGRISDQKADVTVFDYDEKGFEEKKVLTIEDCFPYKENPSVTWINITGINAELIKKISGHFGIHPLVAEDIVNTSQRPKVEDHGDHAFLVIKMLYFQSGKDELIAEQINLILGDNYVISFQEMEGDVFDRIRERIRLAKGKIRKMGADYLAYSLLDAVVDHYFVILEKRGEQIDLLENKLMADSNTDASAEIHNYKRDVVFLRKQIWPLREVLSALQRGETNLIKKATEIYLRDVYDHTIQVMDTIESFRDVLSGLHDMHMTNISNKMNEVMKVLTIFATIFIPLTFVAGIYGMNFENIPELHWKYGYPMFWGVMILITAAMLAYFKRKKWL